ncbi:MAG: hypothetical protein AAFV97_03010 [Bacteroidota bacterium]
MQRSPYLVLASHGSIGHNMRDLIILISLVLLRVFFLRNTAKTTDTGNPQVEPDLEDVTQPLPTYVDSPPPVTQTDAVAPSRRPAPVTTEHPQQRVPLAHQPGNTRRATPDAALPMRGHTLSRILKRRSGLKQGVLWMTVLAPKSLR